MKASGIAAAFESLEDPRREQGQLHKLIDICAVVSGDET